MPPVRFTTICRLVTAIAVLFAPAVASAVVYPPETSLTATTMPSIPRPGYLAPITDPVFGTTITRISDPDRFGAVRGNRIAHVYAKNQPWNADGSLIMLDWTYPAAILDGRTYRLLRWIHQPSSAAWSNRDPGVMYGTYSATNQLVRTRAATDNDTTVLQRFTEYDTIDFGGGEGNLSNDDRYIALFGFHAGLLDVFVVDLTTTAVVARRSFGAVQRCDCHVAGSINNVTMSQSGRWVLIEYNTGGRGAGQGIWVLDPRNGLADVRSVSASGGGHFDPAIDTAGNEVIVVHDDATSALNMVRLDNGATTTLLSRDRLGYALHMSGRNRARPGWAYISSYDSASASPGRAYYQTLFAVKLDPSATGDAPVERFAHEHHPQLGTDVYEEAAMGVPSPDGSKVMWASNWGTPGAPVLAYVAEMPQPAAPTAPGRVPAPAGAPVLGRLALTRSTIRPGGTTALRFSLSAAARVTVTVDRLRPGRRRSGVCRPAARTGARCVRVARVGVVTRALAAGSPVTFGIPRRVAGRSLVPGRYRLTVIAETTSGIRSAPRRVLLTVR